MKSHVVKMIRLRDWDELVKKTYGRVYSLQQQGGCMDRGLREFTVPDEAEDFKNKTVTEEVNHEEMGVEFKAWLRRDPKKPLANQPQKDQWSIDLWWSRNFYPDFQTVANDLHSMGLIEAGEYAIEIEW